MDKKTKAKTERPAERTVHPIPPLWNGESKILILGSFPSVKSREAGFFYGHPQNRFWKVMASILGVDVPIEVEQKKAMLLSHGIALWDVIASCRIEGSADSSIKNVVPTDLSPLLRGSRIDQIFVNGRTAAQLYDRYTRPCTGMDAVYLPSTSPANAAWSMDRLVEAWSVIREDLG